MLSTTYNSALLAWLPGFDGGAQQTFRLRWRAADSEGFQSAEVAGGSGRHEVAGLRVDTAYSFSVMAVNRLGASGYTGPGVEARTASKYKPAPLTSYAQSTGTVAPGDSAIVDIILNKRKFWKYQIQLM